MSPPIWQTLRSWLSGPSTASPGLPKADADAITELVGKKLDGNSPEPGRAIISFSHLHYNLRLDADITQTFRLTAHQSGERVFAFLIHTEDAQSDEFRNALVEIFAYLTVRPSLKELPKTDLLTGNFFGWPE